MNIKYIGSKQVGIKPRLSLSKPTYISKTRKDITTHENQQIIN